VRIKTKGTGPLIDSIVRLDDAVPAAAPLNFAGVAASSSSSTSAPGQGNWTDRLMAQGRAAEPTKSKLPGTDMQGVADEEWDA
jgi:hypothetical protein